jgi:hypothetical protein
MSRRMSLDADVKAASDSALTVDNRYCGRKVTRERWSVL